jgi:predicted deacylase
MVGGGDQGRHDLRWIEAGTLATGLPLRIAVHELSGARDGPTVGLVAGIHGDEVAPIEALRRLVAELDTATLSGRLLVVPVANPLAFASHTRHTHQDMQNLNRLFPGDTNGWLSEQLAVRLIDGIIPELDVLIDMHAGGAAPTVDYVYIINDEALSATFETRVLYRGPGYVGTFSNVAAERGVRTVVTELGGGIAADHEYVERNLRSLRNALRYLGVLPGEVVDFGPKLVVDELLVLRPHAGGLLVPSVGIDQLGESVPRGALLGSVYNPQTFELLEEFHAPFDPTILILARAAPTRAELGDYAFMVARVPSS